MLAILQKAFATKSAHAWLTLFAAAGIPSAAINGVRDALENIQSQARGLIVQLEHPTLGALKTIANPMRLSDTPVSYRLRPHCWANTTTKSCKRWDILQEKPTRLIADQIAGTAPQP